MSVHRPETLRRYLHYRKKDDCIIVKYGAEWCGPCKKITPLLEKLAKEHAHVYFLDVDVDNDEIESHPDFKDVKNLPHFKIFIGKKLKDEIKGPDENSLIKMVKKYSQLQLVINKNQNIIRKTKKHPSTKPKKDEIKPKKDEIKPKKDEIKPKKDEIKPKKDEIKPKKDEIKPKKDEIKPLEAMKDPKNEVYNQSDDRVEEYYEEYYEKCDDENCLFCTHNYDECTDENCKYCFYDENDDINTNK